MAGLLDTAGAPDVRPQVGEGRQREEGGIGGWTLYQYLNVDGKIVLA